MTTTKKPAAERKARKTANKATTKKPDAKARKTTNKAISQPQTLEEYRGFKLRGFREGFVAARNTPPRHITACSVAALQTKIDNLLDRNTR